MNKINVIISKLNNESFVFEYLDTQCHKIYKIKSDEYGVGTILIGRIKDVKQELKCCFVELGEGIISYLAFSDCNPHFLLNREYDGKYKQGDEILVRITRLPSKNKPYSVSMNVEISGRLSVISSRGEGIFASSKLEKLTRENLITEVSKKFSDEVLSDISCLIRTNAANADLEALFEEISKNINLYHDIVSKAPSRKLYSVLYKPEADFLLRIKENNIEDIEKIVTDDPVYYEQVCNAGLEPLASLYNDKSMPLNILYNLDKVYQDATAKKVYLDCGGYLVIEPTEALTVIDVNSGKYIGKKDNKQCISLVNRQAAIMICKQLALRNISGIVIVDFINCNKEEEKELLNLMKSLTKTDKTKVVVEGFTSLGLLELTRQKIYPSIYEK
ncbi:MAG: ribonuclease E/G [Lachnospiraceae bacterium]|nr:ribonuclease E/G [Lachnospiraceae bacterium]